MFGKKVGIETELSFDRMDVNGGSFPRKLAQCRICHDEDESSNMESPCSCCGSLKVCFFGAYSS